MDQWAEARVCVRSGAQIKLIINLEIQVDDRQQYKVVTRGIYYRSKPKYPVVTLVLYFGYKHRWTAPKTLYETVNVPEELKPYVKDVEINLFEIAFLTDEQVKLFKSDFRILADYFVQKRKNGSYKPSRKKIKHIQALLELLSVVEDDSRFEEVLRDDDVQKGRLQNMCDVMDRAEKIGGDKREAEINVRVATDMLREGDKVDKISRISKLPVDKIKKLADKIGVVAVF